MVVISSRTPEGEPNHCPLCEADVWIEPSHPAGEAPCPQCGCLLWFVRQPGDPANVDVMEPESVRVRLTILLRFTFLLSEEEIADRLPVPLESRHVREYLPYLQYLGERGKSDESSGYD